MTAPTPLRCHDCNNSPPVVRFTPPRREIPVWALWTLIFVGTGLFWLGVGQLLMWGLR